MSDGRGLFLSSGSSQNPDIPELRRHTVLLKLDRPGGRLTKLGRVENHGAKRVICIQKLAVQQQRHNCIGSLRPRRIEFRSLEIDVKGLPLFPS